MTYKCPNCDNTNFAYEVREGQRTGNIVCEKCGYKTNLENPHIDEKAISKKD